MVSLEKEVREYLKKHFDTFQDNTNSHDLDFYVGVGKTSFFIEVKEKKQKYNMNNWKTNIPQEHLFILDDSCARKCFFSGPYGCILIRDNDNGNYFVLDMLTLFYTNKVKVNRQLEDGSLRGKLFIDLRQCTKIKYLTDLEKVMKLYIKSPFDFPECHNPFNEKIETQGTVRNKTTMKYDYFSTR